MNRNATLGLLIVLCSVNAFAALTTNPFPTVTADWSISGEATQIHNGSINDSKKVVLSVAVSDAQGTVSLPALTPSIYWYFSPTQFLQNLNHTLRLNASDLSGNSGLYSYSFSVSAPSQSVTLYDPEFGGTNLTDGFNIVVRTEYSSVCRWQESNNRFGTPNQYKSMRYSFNQTDAGGRFHIINDFFNIIGVTPVPGSSFNLSVSCNWSNTITPAVFPISYISNPPSYYVRSDPQPIVDVDNPVTNFSIDSDQDVWCSLIDETGVEKKIFGPDNLNNYFANPTGTYTDPWTDVLHQEIRVDVTCKNRVGQSKVTTHAIITAYDSPVVVTVTSPLFVRSAQYTLGFRTNKPANCSVLFNGADAPLSSNTKPGTVFTSANPLSIGNNDFTITCNTLQQRSPSVITLSVGSDPKAPVLTSIDAKDPTCDLSRLFWSFNSSDNESGLYYHNYTVKQGSNVVVAWKSTNATTIDERGLSLVNGTKYTLTAFPVDYAGNVGQTKSRDITATTSAVASCDKVAPSTRLEQRDLNGTGMNVSFVCDDLGNPCKDTAWFSFKTNLSDSCPQSGTPTTTSSTATSGNALYTNSTSLNRSFVLRQDSLVCWAVSDNAGNYAWGEKSVDVELKIPVETCTDGKLNNLETGLDCGGDRCSKQSKLCTVGTACQANRDCSTNSCKGMSCATASCTDGIMDGNETGVDCGGTQCPACKEEFGGCKLDSDCAFGKVCSAGICFTERHETEECDPLVENCNVQVPQSNEIPQSGGFGLINIVLIVLGGLLVLGGGAFLVLHHEPAPPVEQLYSGAADNIDQPLTLGTSQQEENQQTGGNRRDLARLRRERNRRRLKKALAGFGSPEDLAQLDDVTHKEIEQAYENFDQQTFAETTKNLLEQDKVDKKDVAVALADIAAKPDADHEAISDLRKTFGLEESQPENQVTEKMNQVEKESEVSEQPVMQGEENTETDEGAEEKLENEEDGEEQKKT